jgi:hypothetical protein
LLVAHCLLLIASCFLPLSVSFQFQFQVSVHVLTNHQPQSLQTNAIGGLLIFLHLNGGVEESLSASLQQPHDATLNNVRAFARHDATFEMFVHSRRTRYA